jgi:hypothetical protein
MHFFHFSDTYYLGSNGFITFLVSTIIFDSFLEGHSSNGYKMLCRLELPKIVVTECDVG